MKMQKSFIKTVWMGLICTALLVGIIFKLSPSLAYSNRSTTPSAQQLAPQTTIIARKYSGNSLYDRLGGYNAIAAVIDDTAQNVFNDPLIGKYFIGLSTNSKQRLRQLLIDQFTQAAGGPAVYTGRSMKLSHSGIGGGLTNAEYDAFVNGIAQALDKNNVNQREKQEVLAFANSFRDEIVER
ncbi:group 1 truncated hemoglobin [Brasilonema sp. UFV-L1]|uniref:group I truncated hemoglobin n=1 Tax=Brasilonema sp. UFV-L1 TaxID=2234130 RepID=UPI00145F3322|nr:group 1 truncated hemoglobin [Brasilonema sp. UFV-L1]NMG11476.1 group 1 truncated hemoglobin [Brasilonema sp. UFV-L1]